MRPEMRTSTLLFIFILLLASCEVSERPASRIYTTTPYPALSELPVKDQVLPIRPTLSSNPEFAFLDDVELFTFSYEIDGHIVGYGASPKNQNRWPTIIYSRGDTYENGRWNYGAAAVRLGELGARGYTVVTYEYGQSVNDVAADQMGGEDSIYLSTLIELAGQIPGTDSKNIGLLRLEPGWDDDVQGLEGRLAPGESRGCRRSPN